MHEMPDYRLAGTTAKVLVSKTQLSAAILEAVFEHWQKRRSAHSNKPLLPRLEVLQEEIARQLLPISMKSHLTSNKLFMNMVNLRQQLERVRMLLDLTKKREMLKKDQVMVRYRQMLIMCGVIRDRWEPVPTQFWMHPPRLPDPPPPEPSALLAGTYSRPNAVASSATALAAAIAAASTPSVYESDVFRDSLPEQPVRAYKKATSLAAWTPGQKKPSSRFVTPKESPATTPHSRSTSSSSNATTTTTTSFSNTNTSSLLRTSKRLGGNDQPSPSSSSSVSSSTTPQPLRPTSKRRISEVLDLLGGRREPSPPPRQRPFSAAAAAAAAAPHLIDVKSTVRSYNAQEISDIKASIKAAIATVGPVADELPVYESLTQPAVSAKAYRSSIQCLSDLGKALIWRGPPPTPSNPSPILPANSTRMHIYVVGHESIRDLLQWAQRRLTPSTSKNVRYSSNTYPSKK